MYLKKKLHETLENYKMFHFNLINFISILSVSFIDLANYVESHDFPTSFSSYEKKF